MLLFHIFQLLFLCVATFSIVVFSEIVDQKVTNTAGEVLFGVYVGQFIEVPNRRRLKTPSLKMSINGATVRTIEQTNDSLWKLKLNDQSVLELSIKEIANLTTEYSLIWKGGGPNGKDREVCFHYAFNDATWYNTNFEVYSHWPMETSKVVPRVFFNYLLDEQSADGGLSESFHAHELLYVTSDGFAILPDAYQPLFIRRDINHGEPVMCFSVNNTAPYMKGSTDASYLDIKLHLFASTNIRKVTDYVVHTSPFIPKPTSIPDETMFKYPSWGHFSGELNDTLKFIDSYLLKMNIKHGEIVSTFNIENTDLSLSPEVDANIAEIHSRGFRVKLVHHPQVLRKGKATEAYFIRNGTSLTPFVDFSNDDARKWYQVLLNKLHYDNQVDSIYAWAYSALGTSLKDDLHFFNEEVKKYPNTLVTKYLETIATVGRENSHSTEYAFKTQHLPIFLQLYSPMDSNDDYFKYLIPNILSLSIGGYSFISPSFIGSPREPNEEMYIRWIQAVTFMPHMMFEYIQRPYSNNCFQLIRKYLELHANHAETFIKLAQKRIETGNPIIRPIWYAQPDEPKTYRINDQFMVGDDILVAPVLVFGQRQRTVFLPPGQWIDQHGKSFNGNGEIVVEAPLEELPFFKRKLT